MTARKTSPWNRKNPRKAAKRAPKTLTPAKKAAARSRAAKAGRRYPNLVDNMWAASGGAAKAKPAKAKAAKRKSASSKKTAKKIREGEIAQYDDVSVA